MSPPFFQSSATLTKRLQPNHHLQLWRRSFIEARIPWVRDRALDHAVEKEKYLRPMIALKNLIKSEPSKSIPISVASENKTHLSLPTRAADFIRRYPSIFQEFLPPGGSSARPHVRLTPEVLELDSEEQFIYDSTTHRQDAADRLLRLLMLTRVNKLPLKIVDRLRWDLGLSHDYVRSLLTDYPDYFQVSTMEGEERPTLALELVCWSDELAVSAIERKAIKAGDKEGGTSYKKGMPLSFPLQYSSNFELEKKVKKWIAEWQKLPYISPYENASHLDLKSDQGEKWIVAVLHEIIHLLVSKKTEREDILCLGECFGLRSSFKRALVNHPGIFYTSNKIRTHTVLLREAYKRDLLIEKHPLMSMRYRYIHLMHKLVEKVKPIGLVDNSKEKKKRTPGEEDKEGEKVKEVSFVTNDEDVSDDEKAAADDNKDVDKENEEEDEDERDEEEDEDEDEDEELDSRQSVGGGRGRTPRSLTNLHQRNKVKVSARPLVLNSSNTRQRNMVDSTVLTTNSRRRDSHRGYDANERSTGRTERSSWRPEMSPRTTERSQGRNERSSWRSYRSQGTNERSQGRNERSSWRSERSPGTGTHERSQGRTERSPGTTEKHQVRTESTERSYRRTEGSPRRTD